MSTSRRKTGKLSLEDEKFILENVSSLSIPEIAEQLNRNVDPIQRFIQRKKLLAEPTTEELEDTQRLISILHNKPFWEALAVDSLTTEEIRYFEGNWIAMVREFNEELTVGEETHLKDWLMLQIEINRCVSAQKTTIETITELEEGMAEDRQELARIGDPDSPDYKVLVTRISQMSLDIANLKSGLPQFTNQYVRLVGLAEGISKMLKATRDKPRDIKTNDNTWWEYIEQLENERFRRGESRKAELLRLAMGKAKKKMSENHVFCDNTVDKILLNYETVEDE